MPVQQCRDDPPLQAGGFFGKRGSVTPPPVPSNDMSHHNARLAMLWLVVTRIAARCQHSNGGAILPCMLEVSSTHVVGEECCAACCQCSNTRQSIVVYVLLNVWIFFPILKISHTCYLLLRLYLESRCGCRRRHRRRCGCRGRCCC